MLSNFEFWRTMPNFCISVFNAIMHVFYLAAILGGEGLLKSLEVGQW